MPHFEHAAPVVSPAEYQALTLQEVGDELVVGGVVYSRSEWEPDAEDGVRHHPDDSTTAPARTVTPTTAGSWDVGNFPF
ncbi:hypothetical protein [Streptomyces sp. NPDC058371]|uniref:hypothetical protein n=1 Tax=Streptomyces sp. NPDC058371 TaxID=3346463 RepID=UPI003651F83D